MNTSLSEKEKLAMLALGLAGEVGELVDAIKKHVYHGHELDLTDFRKELGDVAWYYNNLLNELGIDHEVVYMENVMKLQKRYVKGFSEEASKKRVDVQE